MRTKVSLENIYIYAKGKQKQKQENTLICASSGSSLRKHLCF